MERDSTLGTIVVALVLCIVCSVLVTSTAVLLRDRQEANRLLDQRRNVVKVAGLVSENPTADEINNTFDERINRILVNLDEGTVVPGSEIDYDQYSPQEAANSAELSTEIDVTPNPGVKRREKYAFVYQVLDGDRVDQYVLPIYGKGLWSTLYGYLALDADGRTLRGITFYQHGETPGLGGEVDNETWKARWASHQHPDNPKYAYGEEGEVRIRVIKGSVDSNNPDAEYMIDGLSGATITTRGVSDLVQYWLGPHGFGPYIKSQAAVGSSNGGAPSDSQNPPATTN